MTVYSKKTKKGIRWYFQKMINGEYHRGGGYLTKKEAKDAENLTSPNRQMAFGELCDKYLSWIKNKNQSPAWIYEKSLFIKKHLEKWFTLPIDDITQVHIEEHLFGRAKRGTGATANKDFKFIKSIFTFGVQMGYCSIHPCSGIRPMATEERIKYVPSLKDFIKVYNVANITDKRLLALLFCTLGRIGEILSLKPEDGEGDYIVLRSRKHKDGMLKERRISHNDITREAFGVLGKGHGRYLFENKRSGNRFLRRPKLMQGLCKKAGVKPFTTHSIRHLATSVLMKEGESIQTLKDLLGHAKITTTQIYLHSLEDSLDSAAQKLGNVFNKNSIKFMKNSIKTTKGRVNVRNCADKKIFKSVDIKSKIR